MTPNAAKILDIIKCSDHPTADDIYMEIKSRGMKISPATVYNSLASLYDEGLIVKLPEESGAMRYDKNLPHGHMVCTHCGKIMDLFLDDFPAYLAEKSDVSVEAYDLRVFYTCDKCAPRL